jgi:hypothetical protein
LAEKFWMLSEKILLLPTVDRAPEYTDARVALMNVEYWSGRSAEALEQANRILAGDPGNTTARAVRDRLEAATRAWWATTSYTLDVFNDDIDPWQEFSVYVTRKTPVGAVIVRGNPWLPPATAGSAERRAPSREPRRHPAVGSSSARR